MVNETITYNLYAILDIETTGGKYNEEGITEIAVYKFDGHEIIDQFSSLVNPEKIIQPFVVNLTGINNEMLRNAPKFYEVAKRIIEITEGTVHSKTLRDGPICLKPFALTKPRSLISVDLDDHLNLHGDLKW